MTRAICPPDDYVFNMVRKLARARPGDPAAKRIYVQAASYRLLDEVIDALRLTLSVDIESHARYAKQQQRQHLRVIK